MSEVIKDSGNSDFIKSLVQAEKDVKSKRNHSNALALIATLKNGDEMFIQWITRNTKISSIELPNNNSVAKLHVKAATKET